jgi:hypothetical protein
MCFKPTAFGHVQSGSKARAGCAVIRRPGMGGLVNHRRLLEPIGNLPPAEAEARCYARTEDVAIAA